MEINALPAEMLIKVFSFVPVRDRKNVVLVSKRWREVGEDPSLWTWCRIRVYSKDDIHNLSMRRLKHIQEIQISANITNNYNTFGNWKAILLAVNKLHRLKKLDFSYNNLSSVEPELLARVVNKMEDVKLWKLTNDQLQALFTAMCQNSQLKKLDLDGNNLSSVEPELFGRAVNRLEDVNLGGTSLTNLQKMAIFTSMSLNSQLKKLDLTRINLSSVDSELFARGITKLQEFNSFLTNITIDQLNSLFTALSRNTQLKKLSVFSNNLSSVDPELLARGVTRLEDVYFTNITNEQSEAIFTAISQNNSQLKKLNLRFINLSCVDPAVLAKAVARLEEVDLRHTELSTEQLNSLLKSVQKDTKLKKLLLQGNQIAELDVDVVSNAGENLGGGLDLDTVDMWLGK